MAPRSLLLVATVVLCTFQVSQAGILPSWTTLTNAVDSLKSSAESTFNATLASIASKVEVVETALESNVSSAITAVTSEVNDLITDAESEGISVSTCGITASANLTKIFFELPVSLSHCYTDYLDVFAYYLDNIENDIALSYQAISDASSEAANCSLLSISCYADLFYNATTFEASKAADVAFQLMDSATAAINLVATITQCDEEKTTQALLDVYEVLPSTQQCIADIKAGLTANSSS